MLALAAPANVRPAADASHAFSSSALHLFRKLVRAAPASFFSPA